MGKIPFPSESIKLARIEEIISGDLSLNEIDELGSQILNIMTEKTKGIAYGLLGRLEEKQTKLIHQEISLLEADSDLFSKIEKFKNLLFFLSPEEKRIHLESIKILCRSLYEKIEPDLIKTAQREIDFLEFREAFPIIEDLFGQDPSSFASQMQSIAYKIEKTNVLDSLKFLNNAQKKAIYSGRRNG